MWKAWPSRPDQQLMHRPEAGNCRLNIPDQPAQGRTHEESAGRGAPVVLIDRLPRSRPAQLLCAGFLIACTFSAALGLQTIDGVLNMLPKFYEACGKHGPPRRPLAIPAGADQSPPRHVMHLLNTHGTAASHQAASYFQLSCWLAR